MKDRIQRRVPEDRSQVELHEQWQITYWTLTLQTTQERLVRAVREVGTDTESVRRWLDENPPPRRSLYN
ncbi:DUF3606 domain-containing protein [Pantoea sp. Mb-10]|uniref:DUF3606 domain-containing protein n=1 Tax=unclassified Pantoea TaxID=2630326 RepID=UPI001E5AF9F2|nr:MULTISPECIES: DUF3606 domain-containing protein [unclassified Pantoea]MCE0491042.1 DUF3606 domain-containing protein [Pantoea sp. Mb-10]MCE0502531.1 DUF3606 domain-containing protein [Pantoea sp. Pb-8]